MPNIIERISAFPQIPAVTGEEEFLCAYLTSDAEGKTVGYNYTVTPNQLLQFTQLAMQPGINAALDSVANYCIAYSSTYAADHDDWVLNYANATFATKKELESLPTDENFEKLVNKVALIDDKFGYYTTTEELNNLLANYVSEEELAAFDYVPTEKFKEMLVAYNTATLDDLDEYAYASKQYADSVQETLEAEIEDMQIETSIIKKDGDGDKYLADDGEYHELHSVSNMYTSEVEISADNFNEANECTLKFLVPKLPFKSVTQLEIHVPASIINPSVIEQVHLHDEYNDWVVNTDKTVIDNSIELIIDAEAYQNAEDKINLIKTTYYVNGKCTDSEFSITQSNIDLTHQDYEATVTFKLTAPFPADVTRTGYVKYTAFRLR